MSFRRTFADSAMQIVMKQRLGKMDADVRKWLRRSGLRLRKQTTHAYVPITVINPKGKIFK